jgi:ABC-type glycerol-3-phosphate transport system substrate-binding protein
MCSKSQKKEATAKFMHWLATPEVENTFPMNLSPLKGVDSKQQVAKLDELFPGMYGDRAIWWFDQWNAAAERHTTFWNEPVVPSEEVNKIFNDEMVRLFNDETTPEEIYDTIKPQIEAVCKICPRQDGKTFE